MKTVVIAGAIGLIGKQLLEMLLVSSRYVKVVALTRSPLTSHHPKLRNIITPFSDLEESTKDLHSDDVFCCLGTTMAKAGSAFATSRSTDRKTPGRRRRPGVVQTFRLCHTAEV